ncbi:DUF2442 domain-containing protein [Rhizobium sp. WL3]|uniref:DUF2442 domain-containing protein n=1 Tax=Rhizobium sp. WL3 TaxID=2603277 RepID=UPI0011C20098|nr:DUF2442 domain-containing protein [Rhizobium sp. WL3]QEE47101.1 DUF2442 domain-containing protein [Rhizobium sp. WL3]
MADFDEGQFDAAEARGRAMLETEPRAVGARYEAKSGRVVLDLANGCVYAFPTALIEDLQGASAADLGAVEIDGLGFNLHFPALDVDLQVPALIAGIFGTRAWMTRELARRAGQVTSEAKAAAARTNGAKGGRPRRAI